MILAAGLGSRLRPLTSHLPKPLVPIMNRPLLWHLIRRIRAAGIHEIALNLHYKGEQIRDWLGCGSQFGVEVTYSEENELLGSAGGVRRLRDFFGNESALIIHGDILFDVDLAEVIQYHLSRSAQATLVLHPAHHQYNYGMIRLNAQGEIAQFVNHRAAWVSGSLIETLFTGVQILAPSVLDAIPETCVAALTTDVYPDLLTQEARFYGYLMQGYWSDIGTPRRYWEANLDAVSRRVGSAIDRAEDEPNIGVSRQRGEITAGSVRQPVACGVDVAWHDNMALGPEVIIGEGCQLAAGVRITQSILWPHVRVGRETTIERSIIMSHVIIPKGSCLVEKIVSLEGIWDL